MVTVKSERNVERRVSSRLQEKQRLEKERLVRRRVQLLEKDDDDDDNEGKRSKIERVGVVDDDLEKTVVVLEAEAAAASKALEDEDIKSNNKVKSSPKSKGKEKSSKIKNRIKMMDVDNEGNANASDVVVGDADGSVKSADMKVKETLRLFNKHYLQFVQDEEERCSQVNKDNEKKTPPKNSKSPKSKSKSKSKKNVSPPKDLVKKKSKRPDLKTITKMIHSNEVLYHEKRIGHLPGINVGHQFYSRAEMVVVGLHCHWLNGIDFKGVSCSKEQLKGYEGCELPLATSIVMSGMYEDDLDKAEEIIYTGQGGHDLNGNKRQVMDQKLERGNLGLKNCIEPGVPVRVTRGHDSELSYTKKLYTYDGLYNVTEYWAEKGIAGFTVFKFRLKRCAGQPTLTTSQVNFINGRVPQSISEIRGLVCKDITGGQEKIPIPATNLKGLKHRLEVFRTSSKGWGVRSWDFIPSGAPVCEYTGKLMRSEDLDNVLENNYIFEIDCLQTMKGIGGREADL
ncbi:hypothetical protein ACFE04_021862 [Oxalis oulophora]